MLKLADLINASIDELAKLGGTLMGKPVATYPNHWLVIGAGVLRCT